MTVIFAAVMHMVENDPEILERKYNDGTLPPLFKLAVEALLALAED